MPLQQRHINELKHIHEQKTGETLSDAEAWDMATRLISIAHTIISYDTKQESGDLRQKID